MEDTISLQDLNPSDVPALLALNNAHASETSWLEAAAMAALLKMAFYARGIDGGATAFLLALDQNAVYLNPNFEWFKARRETFLYIDRVIVAATARRLGIACLLYRDLFIMAQRHGYFRVVCEVNLYPSNPASDAFHQRMGFLEVGQASIHGGTKTVRYFEKVLL